MSITNILKLANLKPIRGVLIGGNFNIMTHCFNEVIITPKCQTKEAFYPVLKEYDDFVEIGGHSFSSFFSQKKRIELDIIILEMSDFSFKM